MNVIRRSRLELIAWCTLGYACAAAAALGILAVEGCQRPAPAQWGGGPCAPVGRASPYVAVPALHWHDWDQDPERSYLWRGRTLVGGWCHVEGICRSYDATTATWSEPTEAPIAPPVRPAQNFGLMQEKLNGTEKVRINGRAATAAEAIQTIANSVPDVAKKPRVVIIDADAVRRKQVRDELGRLPECADCVVQAYAPDHWHLLDLKTRQPGFVIGGAPTIYLLAADGQVLHRQDDYTGGAAAAAEAFRRARADYDPRKDPDRRKPQPAPLPSPQPSPAPPAPAPVSLPAWAWALALGAAVLFFLQRRHES